jgi:hypothetical protein
MIDEAIQDRQDCCISRIFSKSPDVVGKNTLDQVTISNVLSDFADDVDASRPVCRYNRKNCQDGELACDITSSSFDKPQCSCWP